MADEISLTFDTGALAAAIERQAQERALAGAQRLRDFVVEQMESAKSGQTYKIPGTGVEYTASAAGEYPAVRSGNLVQSLQVALTPEGAAVGTNLEEAAIVERLRPWMARAGVELADEIEQIARDGWQ